MEIAYNKIPKDSPLFATLPSFFEVLSVWQSFDSSFRLSQENEIMTNQELLNKVKLGESQHREFKLKIDNPESIAGEIVAFANSEGGTIYIGVDDDGNIAGLEDANITFQSLINICRDRCIPPISPVIEEVKLGVHAERNRAIATLLTQMDYMSAIGTGIPRLIIRLTRDLSGREPEFELIGEELRVRIWAKQFPAHETSVFA